MVSQVHGARTRSRCLPAARPATQGPTRRPQRRASLRRDESNAMADGISIEIESLAASGAVPSPAATSCCFVGEDLALSPRAAEIAGPGRGRARDPRGRRRAVQGQGVERPRLAVPAGLSAERLVVIGTGSEEAASRDWATLGGFTAGKVGSRPATVVLEWPGTAPARTRSRPSRWVPACAPTSSTATRARSRRGRGDRRGRAADPAGARECGLKKALRGSDGSPRA